MYYDTHTHLNDDKLYKNWRKHLQHFSDNGGKGLVTVGVDEEYNEKAIEIAREAKNEKVSCRVKATIGYHPSEVCFGKITRENIDEKMDALKALYEKENTDIVAIGECGIDVHYPDGSENIELQKELFRRQCSLARELRLPIVIHSRDDFASTLEVIREYRDQKIYFHCYGYGAEEIRTLQETFSQLWVGFCGNLTYPKAENLREAIRVCKPENIVLETDAPYLSPQEVRGKTNEPAYVKHIYQYAAEFMKQPLTKFSQGIMENVKRLYGLR